MSFDQQIAYRPLAQNRCGAYCMLCNRPSDSEEFVEDSRGERGNFAKVLVKCHGTEELGTFEFGSSDWDESDLKSAMQRRAWFDPLSHQETAGTPNNGIINDEGDL